MDKNKSLYINLVVIFCIALAGISGFFLGLHFSKQNLVDNSTKNEPKITNVENELIYNYYNQSTWRGFKVIPFSNPKIKEYLPNYKEVYNTYKAVVQKMDNEITVKDAAE